MKATLKLNNPLWKTPERKAILSKAVQASAAELEKEIKQTILNSTPRGRLYRRGAITRAASKKNLALGLRRLKGNAKRVYAGAKFHRASAKGQPFASDTGQTINAIRTRKLALLKARVAASVKHGAILDDPKKLNRPFFASVAEKFKPKFKENIQKAIAQNS